MRRLLTSVLCGSLMFCLGVASLLAAPARRTKPAPRAEPKAAEPGAAAERRKAPLPRIYQLAEPSPAVKKRVKKIRLGGKILMYTGITLSGLGFVSTIAGAVLIGVTEGQRGQRAGIINLIAGTAGLTCGVVLWAIGQSRMNKAEELLIKAKVRQVQLQDPMRQRRSAHALAPPRTHLVFSAQLRF